MARRAIQILLIEDNPIDARVVQSYLSGVDDLRIEVTHATSLTSGLALLEKRPFSLILLDLGLPESCGLATFLHLHGAHPEVPIVVLTGLDATELGDPERKGRAEDYLAKWLEPNLLVRTIRFAIERAHRRRADEKRRQSEKRFRTLFQQSPDGILLIDPQTAQPVEFNDVACRHLGYTREEFGQLRISDYDVLESPEQTRARIEAVLREGHADFETRHRTKTGEIRDVDVTVRRIELTGRQWLHVIFRDVTEHKRAEEMRQEMEARFQTFASKSVYGYAELSAQGRVLLANQRVLEILGYPAEMVVGRNFAEFVPEVDLDSLMLDFAKAFVAGQVSWPQYCALRNRSGETRTVAAHSIPYQQSGRPPRLLCLLLDVTEQRRSQEALRESEAKLRTLVENMPDLVILVDSDSRILFANRAIMADTLQELLGSAATSYVVPEQRQRCREVLAKAMAEQTTQTMEAVDLEGRWWQCRVVPMRDEEAACRAMVICTDITEHRQVQLALGEREHRYRQLLAAITNYSYSVELQNGVPVSTDHSWGCLGVTGYTPEEYRSDPFLWINMVHPQDQQMVRDYAARILSGASLPPIEHRIIRRDRAVRWLRDTIVPHRNGDQLVRYDGLVEDITDRWCAEHALRENAVHLSAAAKIQERLLPAAPPCVPGFDIGGQLHPSKIVAGDFFDYLAMSNGDLGFVIGDVTGHGFGPSLLMASTSTLIRSLAEGEVDLGAIMSSVNRYLVKETDDDQFVTLVLALLNPRERSIVYANAGHPPGYVLDASGNVKVLLESTGFPLAILPDTEFPAGGPIVLDPGDLVLFTTDGAQDAVSPDGLPFGADRVLEVVRANLAKSAHEIVKCLYQAVCNFSQCEKPIDDVTVMVIKTASCTQT